MGMGIYDVVFGAYRYTDGANTNEAGLLFYHGSSTGLSASPTACGTMLTRHLPNLE